MTFSDNFNRPDNPASMASPWLPQSGVWGTIGNQAYCSTLSDGQETTVVDSVSADGSVSVTIPVHGTRPDLPGGPGHGAGICFRAIDNDNYWVFDAVGPTGNDPTLYVRVGGIFTLVSQVTSPWTDGDSYEIVLAGTSITVKRNGSVLIPTVTSATHRTATKHGLRLTNDGTVRFDNFSCPDLRRAGCVVDTFDRSDSSTTLGSADSGQSWVPSNGTWGRDSGRAYLVSSTPQAVAGIDCGADDMDLTVTITFDPTSADPGVVVRQTDDDNYILVNLNINADHGGRCESNIFAKIAGSYANLGANLDAGMVLGGTNTLRLTVIGDAVNVYRDGTLYLSAALNPAQVAALAGGTKGGIRANIAGIVGGNHTETGGSRFDDFSLCPSQEVWHVDDAVHW